MLPPFFPCLSILLLSVAHASPECAGIECPVAVSSMLQRSAQPNQQNTKGDATCEDWCGEEIQYLIDNDYYLAEVCSPREGAAAPCGACAECQPATATTEAPEPVAGPTWSLAGNINSCDGENFGYGAMNGDSQTKKWEGDHDVGSTSTAFKADFVDKSVWAQTAGYVAIARHIDGKCEMAKTWELTDKTKSLKTYFSTYPGQLKVTGDASQQDQHIHEDVPASTTSKPALSNDPIFGAGGGLVFNWFHSNNGARIAVPGTYKDPYQLPTSENNDDVHGLGNEFGASTRHGGGSSKWWHDVAMKQEDCHGTSCKMVGTDHGTMLHDGECGAQYAIFVSTSATQFQCQGKTLSQTETM